MVRLPHDPTPAGRDYRAALRAGDRDRGPYPIYAGAWLRDGPVAPAGDVGPPISARPIAGRAFAAAGRIHHRGEFVRRTEDGREIWKPGEPFAATEWPLAV